MLRAEIERRAIGAIFVNPEWGRGLTTAHFTIPAYRDIFACVEQQNGPFDLLTIRECVRKINVIAPLLLPFTVDNIPEAADVQRLLALPASE